MPAQIWDAEQYLRFADARTLPAIDLLSRIAFAAPQRVVDLGCGPGNSTAPLKARWPEAAVIGIDSSEELLAAGRRDHPGIDFVRGDIADWTASVPLTSSSPTPRCNGSAITNGWSRASLTRWRRAACSRCRCRATTISRPTG
jgi:SAM-dependent methyltransferase